MWIGAAAAVAIGVGGIVLVTRGGDDGPAADPTGSTVTSSVATSVATSIPTDSTSPTTIPATTVEATTTAPAPTTAPATTVPVTTVTPTTVPPPETTVPPATVPPPLVPPGWTASEFPEQAYPQLWEGNWYGVPSPQITDATAALPDGRYAISYVSQVDDTLTLDFRRFELCSVLGTPTCFEGPWAADELGVTDPIGRATLFLDDTVRVVISGWECEEVVGQGSGPDLAALYASLYADYDAAFGPGLVSGTDTNVIVEQVRAAPVGGFGPPPDACDDGYSLEWRSGSAPTFLVQWPFDWETGGWRDPATLLVPSMVEIAGPLTTLYFYAGFYS